MALVMHATPTKAQEDETGHPAHIHVGTCDELGEIAWALSDVGPGSVKNGEARTAGQTIGDTSDVYPVAVSVTTVDASLTQMVDGAHAVNIHESKDKIQNYIACGNIGGTIYGEDLVIGLETLNDSSYSGIAVLHGKGDSTVVTVYLSEGLGGDDAKGGDDASTPSADGDTTPAADIDTSAQGGQEAVSITEFQFGSGSLDIAVGTTVTWTNDGGAPHTVTGDNGEFDSGTMQPGDTFSFTFDTAGTVAYHCDIHPAKMQATVNVS